FRGGTLAAIEQVLDLRLAQRLAGHRLEARIVLGAILCQKIVVRAVRQHAPAYRGGARQATPVRLPGFSARDGASIAGPAPASRPQEACALAIGGSSLAPSTQPAGTCLFVLAPSSRSSSIWRTTLPRPLTSWLRASSNTPLVRSRLWPSRSMLSRNPATLS